MRGSGSDAIATPDLLLLGDTIATPGLLLQGVSLATPLLFLGGRLLRRLPPDAMMTTTLRRPGGSLATLATPVALHQGPPGLGLESLLLLVGPRRLHLPDDQRRANDVLTTPTTLFDAPLTPRSRLGDPVAFLKATLHPSIATLKATLPDDVALLL